MTLPFDVNLADPATFERGIPHEAFTWLREHAPVYWHEHGPQRVTPLPGEPPQRGFWVLTRYRDIVAVSKDPECFSSARGSMLIRDLDEGRLQRMRGWLINLDAPRHTRIRRLVSKAYSIAFVRQFEPVMRAAARATINAVCERGACDFAIDVAGPMPFQVTAEILGIPVTDRPKVATWLDQVVGLEDADPSATGSTHHAAAQLFDYLADFGREQRRQPSSALVQALLASEVDGELLDTENLEQFLLLFTMASNETTRNAIANGMQALLEHPQQHRRLLAEPQHLDASVDEMLRYAGPAIHMRRTASRDTEIAGQPIRENDKVLMFYSAANRDESVFPKAQSFDVVRQPNPHLAFGVGPHFCLGAQQSWSILRCFFAELLPRLPDLTLNGPVVRLHSLAINGIRSLPVHFTPTKPNNSIDF